MSTFISFPSAPSESPSDVRIDSITTNSVRIQWHPISEHAHNGHLLGYTIRYHSSCYNHGGRENVSASTTSYTLSGLRTGARYDIWIAGYTLAGIGQESYRDIFTCKSSSIAEILRKIPWKSRQRSHLVSEYEIQLALRIWARCFWPSSRSTALKCPQGPFVYTFSFRSEAINCFVYTRNFRHAHILKWLLILNVRWNKHATHSHISGTQGVNTTPAIICRYQGISARAPDMNSL